MRHEGTAYEGTARVTSFQETVCAHGGVCLLSSFAGCLRQRILRVIFLKRPPAAFADIEEIVEIIAIEKRKSRGRSPQKSSGNQLIQRTSPRLGYSEPETPWQRVGLKRLCLVR